MAKGDMTQVRPQMSFGQMADRLDLPRDYNSRALNFEYVTTQEGVREAMEVMSHPAVTRIGFDIETTGSPQPWMGTIRLFQFAVEVPTPRQFVIDLWHCDVTPTLALLTDPELVLISCGGKFEQTHAAYRYGVTITNAADVCYAEQALNKITGATGLKGNFKELMFRYAGMEISKAEQTSEWDREELTDSQKLYAALDAAGLLDIHRGQCVLLADAGAATLARNRTEEFYRRAYESVEAHMSARNDQADRLLRALDHSRTITELDFVAAQRSRLTIAHCQRERLDEAYARKWVDLMESVGAPLAVAV